MVFALGEMGLSFAEYAALTPFLFIQKMKGFKAARRRSDINFRNVAYILALPNAKKGLKPGQLWSIEGDEVTETQYRTKRQMTSFLNKYFKNKQKRLDQFKPKE